VLGAGGVVVLGGDAEGGVAADGPVVEVLVPGFAVVVVDRRFEAMSRCGPEPEVGEFPRVTVANRAAATATAATPMRMSVRGERRRLDASLDAGSSITTPVSRNLPRF
jgi:hypothetical protein